MDIIYKSYEHNPPHLFQPHSHYFITGATLYHIHHFDTNALKEKTVEYMFTSFRHFDWIIEDWVLLDNHYHIMAKAPERAATLPQVINNFHKYSAIWLVKQKALNLDHKIWHNYWDTCITFETSYFARLHYLWFNPVKHGYVKNAGAWPFGSFHVRHADETTDIIKKYPIDRLSIRDNF